MILDACGLLVYARYDDASRDVASSNFVNSPPHTYLLPSSVAARLEGFRLFWSFVLLLSVTVPGASTHEDVASYNITGGSAISIIWHLRECCQCSGRASFVLALGPCTSREHVCFSVICATCNVF